jgi:Ca2+-binding EF-hand superfamily protein
MKGLIGERIFNLYDTANSNNVCLKDFLATSYRFFQSSFEDKLKLVFDIFDFDKDGQISEDDIRTILSHIPLELIVYIKFIIFRPIAGAQVKK